MPRPRGGRIARPTPDDSNPVAVTSDSAPNSSKNPVAPNRFVIPGPSSWTVMRMRPCCAVTPTMTRPSNGVCLIALPTRFFQHPSGEFRIAIAYRFAARDDGEIAPLLKDPETLDDVVRDRRHLGRDEPTGERPASRRLASSRLLVMRLIVVGAAHRAVKVQRVLAAHAVARKLWCLPGARESATACRGRTSARHRVEGIRISIAPRRGPGAAERDRWPG